MDDSAQRLSYKFQRLRERLRDAITNGELAGKLPGERVLARQFRVNAKTLSKALTDLAAEGLLERTIGRGTFVRGGTVAVAEGEDTAAVVATADTRSSRRWLLVAPDGCAEDPLCEAILRIGGGDHEVVTDLSALRPSLVNQFDAVVDVHGALPETTLRDLLLRCRRLIRVDAPPRTYSTHAVLVDRPLAAAMLTRDLLTRGLRTLCVITDHTGEDGQVTGPGAETLNAVRSTARRLDPAVVVRGIRADAVVEAAGGDDVAIVCPSAEAAAKARDRLARGGVSLPQDATLACVGILDLGDPAACSGYVVTTQQVAQTVAQLIAEPQLNRPTSLWLVGTYVDRCTALGDAECPDTVAAAF